jgi:hypothetical protein
MTSDMEKAVKDARIAAALAGCCVLLVGLLLMIDGQRNKWMAQQIDEVRRIFAEFQGLVMASARPAAAQAAPVGGGADHGGGTGGHWTPGVVADAEPGAGVDSAGGAAAVPVNGAVTRRTRAPGGPRGDG